jgi:hypothetical protein
MVMQGLWQGWVCFRASNNVIIIMCVSGARFMMVGDFEEEGAREMEWAVMKVSVCPGVWSDCGLVHGIEYISVNGTGYIQGLKEI